MSKQRNEKMTRRRALTVSATTIGAGAIGVGTKTADAATGRLAGKKVLIGLGEFSEGLETYYIVYRLIEEGVKPVVAAAAAKRLHTVVHDIEPQYSNYTEKLGYIIEADVAYRDVQPAEYDGMVIPGGRGPEEMRQDRNVLEIVRYFLDNDLPLGAMCHGPQVVYAAGPIKGRKITANYGIRPDVELAGAIFVDKPFVTDGKLVTSRGWPDLPHFMHEFLRVLEES